MNLKLFNAVKYLSLESAMDIAKSMINGESGYEKDKETALEILRDLGLKGHDESQFLLYSILKSDNYLEEAFYWLKEAVINDFPKALTQAYSEYNKGNVDWLDEEESINCIKRAAEIGYPLAIGILGDLYMCGNRFVECDEALAKEYYEIASSKGDANSFYKMYLLNDNIDKKLRLSYLKQAAKGGIKEANYSMWKELSTEAFHYLEEAIDLKSIEAYYDYARLQETDVFIDRDIDAAINTYKILSKINHVGAANRLVLFSEFDEDIEEYRSYLSELIENDSLDSLVILTYNQILKGLNINENFKLLKKAASLDCHTALYFIGKLMMYGDEINGCINFKNEVISQEYFYRAAKLGNFKAMEKIAFEAIKDNRLVKISNDEILEFLSNASNSGVGRATNLLGVIYFKGKFVDKNDEIAEEFFREAIDQGEYIGWYNLGMIYETYNNFENAQICFKLGAESDEYFSSIKVLNNSNDYKFEYTSNEIEYLNNRIITLNSLDSEEKDKYCSLNRIIL